MFSLQSLVNALSSLVSNLKSYVSGNRSTPSTSSTTPTGTTTTTKPLMASPTEVAPKGSINYNPPTPDLGRFFGSPIAGAETVPNRGGGSVGYQSTPPPVNQFTGVPYYGGYGGGGGSSSVTPSTPLPTGQFKTSTPTPSAATDIIPSKAPTNIPITSPQPSFTPPSPVGGSGYVVTAGGGGGAPAPSTPRESALPPTPTLPTDAIGKYEAMMRSLLAQYGNTGKVPVPLAGASPFGVGSAFGEILKQLQQRVRP